VNNTAAMPDGADSGIADVDIVPISVMMIPKLGTLDQYPPRLRPKADPGLTQEGMRSTSTCCTLHLTCANFLAMVKAAFNKAGVSSEF
jgi:hypothetical protein